MTTLSLSARRAWIEIEITITDIDFRMSLSARRAWIEILASGRRGTGAEWSLSARRAWIEIFMRREISLMRPVALRKESVDRNTDLVLNA